MAWTAAALALASVSVQGVEFDLGLRYDRSRSGHGLEIHRAGDAYPTFFYTYRDDLSPDWFLCDARVINGVLQGECSRYLAPPELAPPVRADRSDRAFLAVDYVAAAESAACRDGPPRPGAQQLAEFTFTTIDEHHQWCTEFLAPGLAYPDPYYGGVWYGGDDGGYGCSMSHMDRVLSAICYYYDALGEPRWAIGLTDGLDLKGAETAVIPMVHYRGFCRGCETVALQGSAAGVLTLQLDPDEAPGGGASRASLMLDYPQDPGGSFQRDFPLYRLTDGQTRGAHHLPEAPIRSDSEVVAWEEDLKYFADSLRQTHPSPFHDTAEATFEGAFASLRRRLAYLSDPQVAFEFSRLGALISRNGRDGHTSVIPINSMLLPLQFYWFSDGVFVVDALPPHEDLIGSRVVSAGDKPIEEVIRRLSPTIARDNDNTVRWTLPTALLLADLYPGAGIAADASTIPLALMAADGQVLEASIEPISLQAYFGWKAPGPNTLPSRPVLHLSQLDRAFWFTTLAEDDAIYVQYNAVVAADSEGLSLAQFTAALGSAIEADTPGRIIIDLRHNNGGDNTTYGPLLELLSGPTVNQAGRLYALIGRQTFSAAMNFIADLEAATEVIFVGEGSGGSPMHFGDSLDFFSPNFGLLLQVSSRVHASPIGGDERLEIPAHVPVALSSGDFFGDLDPVLESALGHSLEGD